MLLISCSLPLKYYLQPPFLHIFELFYGFRFPPIFSKNKNVTVTFLMYVFTHMYTIIYTLGKWAEVKFWCKCQMPFLFPSHKREKPDKRIPCKHSQCVHNYFTWELGIKLKLAIYFAFYSAKGDMESHTQARRGLVGTRCMCHVPVLLDCLLNECYRNASGLAK